MPQTQFASAAFVFHACQSQPLVRQSSKESRINSFCAQLAIGFQSGVPSKCSLDSNVDIIKSRYNEVIETGKMTLILVKTTLPAARSVLQTLRKMATATTLPTKLYLLGELDAELRMFGVQDSKAESGVQLRN